MRSLNEALEEDNLYASTEEISSTVTEIDDKIEKEQNSKNNAYEKAKQTVKDSVFTHLFRDKQYQLELYKRLHPEDTNVKENDIETVTLDAVLVNTLYNDLGIKVKDKMLILVEAQSTWSWNIAVRILYYYADTCRKLYNKNGNSVYSVTKVKILEPEFYMVYTGEGYEDVEYISLAEHFFGKPVGANDSNIDLKVKVIRQNDNDNSILDQYIKFSKVYDKYRKEETDIIEVIKATIDECTAKGILSDYLKKHRNEVYTMIKELYEQELATKSYGDEREAKGEMNKIMEFVKKMFYRGDAIEDIADFVELPIEQVQEIIGNITNSV